MTLRKRLRVLWAALSQTWHTHTCPCGISWECCAPRICNEHELCLGCELQQLQEWELEHHRRMA